MNCLLGCYLMFLRNRMVYVVLSCEASFWLFHFIDFSEIAHLVTVIQLHVNSRLL